ncbi:MAG: hypothetical protein SOH58_06390 [Olsenella sp.]
MTAFINDGRRWDDAMARFLGEITDHAFPCEELPAIITYSGSRIPACDAILYEVVADFGLGEGFASVSFIFDTDEGGLGCVDGPVPPPSISNVQVTYEVDKGGEHRWDPDTGEWSVEKSAG